MKNFQFKGLLCIATAALIIMGTVNTRAQKAEFGLRFMPTFAKFNIVTSDGAKVSGDYNYGYGIGGFFGYNFNEHIGVQTEVIYNTISQQYSEFDNEGKIELKYFNIPLLLSLNTNKYKSVNFNVVIGPEIGINVGSSLSGGDGTGNTSALLSVKKSNVGVAFGAGADFALNEARTFRLGLGFRGVEGLIDISDDSDTVITDSYYVLDDARTSTYALYVGLSFMF